jgi:hypothetical protein
MVQSEGPVRQPVGVNRSQRNFVAEIEFEHFTSIDMKKTLKPKSYQQTSDFMIEMFLIHIQDQQNKRIANRTPKSLNRSKNVS